MNALYLELLEAARAAVAAERDGEPDPLIYVISVLDRHGQLPPDDMTAMQCLALIPEVRA
jgi:hypothetical protein